MGACGAFQIARAEMRGGMLCVRACRRAPPAVCMPKRPRIRSARAGQRPAPRHHQGRGHTAKSGRDCVLARARSTVKCCQNPGQIKSETRSDRIRTGGQINRNPQWRPSQYLQCRGRRPPHLRRDRQADSWYRSGHEIASQTAHRPHARLAVSR